MQRFLKSSLFKYLLVGIVNTIFGYCIIFALMFFGVIPETANLIGYICGIILSYFLNKTFTFKSQNSHKKDFWRFAIAMALAYLINLAVLVITHRMLGIDKYVSQIISGIFYTASGYIFNRFFAFKNTNRESSEKWWSVGDSNP